MTRWTGHVGAAGRLLTMTVDGRRWTMLVRRLDGACDADLFPLHGRQVAVHRLKQLLRGWPHLRWSHHPAPSAGLPYESRAIDPPYQITLIYPQENASRPYEVVEEFAAEFEQACGG